MKFVDEKLNPDEKLTIGGKQLKYDILTYWQLNLSSLLLNMTRGGFAEYIVLCALDSVDPTGGYMDQVKYGTEPWDVDGPVIRLPGEEPRQSKIEVKSTASVQINTKEEMEPIELPASRLNFGIRQTTTEVDPVKKRHSDLYVFCHYKAKSRKDNMLDMNNWDFYVYPTYKIDDVKNGISEQKTVSVKRLEMLRLKPIGFEDLGAAIKQTIGEIENNSRG